MKAGLFWCRKLVGAGGKSIIMLIKEKKWKD